MAHAALQDFVKNGRKIYGAVFNYKNPSENLKPFEEPVFFLKAPSDYVEEGSKILIPKGYVVVEEIELGMIIGKTCKKVSQSDALNYVGGYCVAFDLTAPHNMNKIRAEGLPWCIMKTFDTSCPVSKFISKDNIVDVNDVELFCEINGKMVQTGSTKNLLFSPAELISFISQYHTLEPNDMILTGTPPTPQIIQNGDVIRGGIKNGTVIEFLVKNDD